MSRMPYARCYLDRATADSGPLTFTASSTGVNRYGYALRAEGWRLENYGANPVVLWAHDASAPPIGRAVAARKDGILIAEITFDTEDPFARGVESKYRRGFLSAVSVGWDFVAEDGEPVEDWWRLSGERIRDEMFYDLAEISAVPVPGDPRALVQHQRQALGRLGRELVELFDEQQHGATALAEIQAAVRAELTRLGITPSHDTTEQSRATGVDQDAARALLAAFTPKESS